MPHRPRVLVVTTNLAPAGGSSKAAAGNTWRLVFDRLGRSVDGLVLAPRVPGAPDRERIGGLEVRRVGPPRPVQSLQDAVRGPNAVRAAGTIAALSVSARRSMRSGTFDLAHAFWAAPAGWACTWPTAPLPVVVSTPGSDLHALSHRRLAGAPVRHALRTADLVLVHHPQGVEEALAAGARRAAFVPICFDPDLFRLSPRIPGDPIVAYAGRITRAKGVFVLADALRRLAVRTPGLRFVACGEGPDADAFGRAIRAALGDRATFAGAVPPRDVARILASARVVAVPSYGEGMSALAIEALATGRSVVTTDTGAAAVVSTGGGRVVPVGDPAGLADGLAAELRAERDPAGLRRLVEPYTPERVADRILGHYTVVAGRRPAPLTFRPEGPTPTDGGTRLGDETPAAARRGGST